MSYLVFCTFDLKGASSQDYKNAYSNLAGIGLKKVVKADEFPELVADYTNLFYCSNGCNSRKGAFWPTSDQMTLGIYVPNPCDHVMFDHMRKNGLCDTNTSKGPSRTRSSNESVLFFCSL